MPDWGIVVYTVVPRTASTGLAELVEGGKKKNL